MSAINCRSRVSVKLVRNSYVVILFDICDADFPKFKRRKTVYLFSELETRTRRTVAGASKWRGGVATPNPPILCNFHLHRNFKKWTFYRPLLIALRRNAKKIDIFISGNFKKYCNPPLSNLGNLSTPRGV